MRSSILLSITIICLLISSDACAQNRAAKKSGTLSFSLNLSDYNLIKRAKDSSSLSKAFGQKDFLRSGKSSMGIGVSYWKGLTSHIDFSGNIVGTFSNFPAFFIKGDSIGQANFSTQLDAQVHFRALREQARINPFLTAGIGVGYFANQLAVYAPIGTGLQFRFKEGGLIFIQSQWRMALSHGINNDYMFYSVGFAYNKLQITAKKRSVKKEKSPKEIAKKEIAVVEPDIDGDGVVDSKDNCPTEKGTINGCPDTDHDGIADKDDKCKDLPGLLRYNGCPVPDTDGDGINDEMDNCLNVAGAKDNHGCPWPDTDADGVSDKDDKCPNVKGTVENKGCPLPLIEEAELIRATPDSMIYNINFDFDRAVITPNAYAVLKAIVDVLKTDKSLRIIVSGHADNLGTNNGNMQVSANRANIVRDYFISYYIDAKRITTTFHGAKQPIDTNQQWRNRRVEITIYKK